MNYVIDAEALSNAKKNAKKDVFEQEKSEMKYSVNDGCIGCGLCADICPKVFSMSDSGVAVAIDAEVPENCLDTAAEAKDSCPVSAIEEA